MEAIQAYNLCCKYQGKCVRIKDNQGNTHIGTITRVSNSKVWIMPENIYGGYGIGFWGLGSGFGYGIALGAITGIVLASAFFW